jgi:hypothetical protein
MSTNTPDNFDRLDQATADRLRRLGSMPVDTTRLDKLIQARIPRAQRRPSIFLTARPFRAIAASVLILVMVGVIILSLSGGAVLASPDKIAQFHEEMVSGRAGTPVRSIEDANQKLAEQWNKSVQIPDVPNEHVMSCCIKTIEDKRVACVLLNCDGQVPVTMTIAKASDMQCPSTDVVMHGGVHYHVHHAGKLNMVMTERDGRWICLSGELPAEQLMDLTGAIRF